MRVRWQIFSFLSAFAMLSYVQRTSLGVAAEHIMPELHLSQLQIGWLNAAFATCYAVFQLPGGIVGQRFGARITFTIVGLVGLVATIATPLAPVLLTGTALFLALLLAQGLLGASQGPVFPTVAIALENWFPQRQWAITQGFNTLCMNVGGAMTPLLIVVLTQHFGWQQALLWVALPAALLTAAWAWYGRNTPRVHPRVTPEELAELDDDQTVAAEPITLTRLVGILRNRDVLLLTVSYFCLNYAFYLMGTWSFLYIVQERDFHGLESGLAGTLPWIGAGIGAGVGGYLSDSLARRLGFRWGYRLVPLIALPAAGLLLLATIGASSAYVAVLALMATFFAIELNEGAYWAGAMRVARADTGAATGVMNTGGNLAGMVSAPIIGALSGSGHWDTAFIIGTGFSVVAGLCWLAIDPDRKHL